MHVLLVEVPDCPHAAGAAARLTEALDLVGRGDVRVDRVVVSSAAEAGRLGAPGSPTILVNGRDLFPSKDSAAGGALACRLYRTPAGLAGVPTVDQLVDALSAWEA